MRTVFKKRTAIALVSAALLGSLIWILARTHLRGGEDEEDHVASTAARVSRAGNKVVVTLSPRAAARIGLKTQRLKPATRAHQVAGYGLVLDPLALARLNSQLEAARAALAASGAQFQRSRRLYREHRNLSLRELQAAQARFRSDEQNFQSLRDQLDDQWGNEIGAMKPAARAGFIKDLVRRRAALAQVNVPAGAAMPAAPIHAAIAVLGDDAHRLTAGSVYRAPTVNPKLQGQSFLLEVRAPGSRLAPGQAVTGYLESARDREHGVVVPRSAVVIYAGGSWVYVEVGAMRFSRKEVRLVHSTANGWFITSGLAPGDEIVVTAAQTLLSEELISEIQIED